MSGETGAFSITVIYTYLSLEKPHELGLLRHKESIIQGIYVS